MKTQNKVNIVLNVMFSGQTVHMFNLDVGIIPNEELTAEDLNMDPPLEHPILVFATKVRKGDGPLEDGFCELDLSMNAFLKQCECMHDSYVTILAMQTTTRKIARKEIR